MKNSMWKKGLVLGIIILFVGAIVLPSTGSTVMIKSSLSTSEGNIFYGGSGPNNYTSIQDAIDNASDGLLVFSCLNTVGLSLEKTENTMQIDNFGMVEGKKLTDAESTDEVFDWPMFHHDIMHTGYTDGKGNISCPCKKWSFQTGGLVFSSPALGDIDNDGIIEVVVGSHDNWVYALDGTNGAVVWKYKTGSWVGSSPALGDIDSDGQVEVVVGSYDKKVYALDGDDNEPPECHIVKPREGYRYLNDRQIGKYRSIIGWTLIIGPRSGIMIEVKAKDEQSGIDRVEFKINDELYWENYEPNPSTNYYEYGWVETRFGICSIEAIAWDKAGCSTSSGILNVLYFNIE